MHHQERNDLRNKFYSTTEKYVALMFALSAFFSSDISDVNLLPWMKIVVCGVVFFLMLMVLYKIYRDNKNSYFNAQFIDVLNQEFGSFTKGKIVNHVVLYTERWKSPWRGLVLHYFVIFIMTALLLISILFNC